MDKNNSLLEVKNLQTYFKSEEGIAKAVDGVSFRIDSGETLAVVGESGSGKSVTSLSIMQLLPSAGYIAGGQILFEGEDLCLKSEAAMRKIRGNDIAMIFQEPMTSLNPVHTVGAQVAESIILHQKKSAHDAKEIAIEMLDLVGIPEARKRSSNYPHQMSGGMRQRVMIATALSCNPKLLIADEPTTALDVSVQAQIIELIKKLQKELGMAMLYISHDLAVVSSLADRIVVMYGGRAVEDADVHSLYKNPRMPYTIGLLHSLPGVDTADDRRDRLEAIPGSVPSADHMPQGCSFHPRCKFATDACRQAVPELQDTGDGHMVRCIRWREVQAEREQPGGEDVATARAARTSYDENSEYLLKVKDLRSAFPIKGGVFSREVARVQAVGGVSVSIRPGEVVGLVGESGSGKTTTGRSILGLLDHVYCSGSVDFNGVDLAKLNRKQMRPFRKDLQLVFQDPYSSLNPRMNVGDIIGEGIGVHRLAHGKEKEKRVIELLERVGLSGEHMKRYPHEFSGGQRQRIAIARALSVEPKLIVADEPVSALDVSIQAQIINLLLDLRDEFGLALLFIAHDLGVVEYVSDRVIVMYLGKMMEVAPAKELYRNPIHPYTQALLSAIPRIDPGAKDVRQVLYGDIPSPINPPSGCVFRTRCPIATAECANIEPPLEEVAPGHLKACIHRPK